MAISREVPVLHFSTEFSGSTENPGEPYRGTGKFISRTVPASGRTADPWLKPTPLNEFEISMPTDFSPDTFFRCILANGTSASRAIVHYDTC